MRDLRAAKQELDINMLLRHQNVVRCFDYQLRPQVSVPMHMDETAPHGCTWWSCHDTVTVQTRWAAFTPVC